MPNKKTIHIIGAGLIGLHISSRLQDLFDSSQTNSSILVHDQASSILGSWSSKICVDVHVNNGFHGIEMPRASLVADFLHQCGCKNLLHEVPNYRLLQIEGQEVPFDASIEDWPNRLSNGLPELLEDYCQLRHPNEIIKKALTTTTIGESISRNYNRFAPDIEQCWHLFFPWFFPSDFSFRADDEGADFQYKVRKKAVRPSYLFPKKLTFESLRPPILSYLESKKINFSLGSPLALNNLEDLISSAEDRVIWCASSFGLLKMLDSALADKCILGTRHMHIALYSVPGKAVFSLKERFNCLPSEILYLDSEAPGLNRISFLDYQLASSDAVPASALLIAEYFSTNRILDDKTIANIKSCIEKNLSVNIKTVGCTYGRPMYSLDSSMLAKATSLIEGYASKNNLSIPYIYYGPINMAKCAIVAKDFDLSIFR